MRVSSTMTGSGVPPLVLLVDDNPDTLEMYALGLRYEGFNVRQAADGEKALTAVGAETFDCIVTDVRMPRMTGLEFRRVLSRDVKTADIPVIALTAMGTKSEIETAKAAGFESVLLKPCLPEHLAREVMRVLANVHKTRARAKAATARSTQALARAAKVHQKSLDLASRHRALGLKRGDGSEGR